MPFDQELLALPHGPEFRFVDEITALEPGISGRGIYTITGNEPFLIGHFPGQPMWPGVIMIEAIAQLGGVIAQSDPAHSTLRDMRLTSVRSAKILGTAYPGDVLIVQATVEGRMGNLIQIAGTVSNGESKIAAATVMLGGK
jgi:3-hydroxyacyl-[acyl-carrier-protein] dehydratase